MLRVTFTNQSDGTTQVREFKRINSPMAAESAFDQLLSYIRNRDASITTIPLPDGCEPIVFKADSLHSADSEYVES